MLVAWISDPHLNTLRIPGAARAFGEYVNEELQQYEPSFNDGKQAVIISGDIAECHNLLDLLADFIEGVARPVYFVMGNHDAYGGSIEAAKEVSRAITKGSRLGVWLTEAGIINLTPGIALVGHDGWYDARNGNPLMSNVDLSDFYLVEELIGRDTQGNQKRLHNAVLMQRLHAMGDRAALEAGINLRNAAKEFSEVFFVTHVPPFARAAWHQGAMSDTNWLPWMSCKAMGDMLIEVANEFPEVKFTVLCGHTHGEGEYIPVPNMTVLTAKATYGHPAVHKFLEI